MPSKLILKFLTDYLKIDFGHFHPCLHFTYASFRSDSRNFLQQKTGNELYLLILTIFLISLSLLYYLSE